MAPSTATAPSRVRIDAPALPAGPRPASRPAPATSSRRRGGSLRRTTVACVTLVLGSLLAVVAANAYMTQGQVELTQMQQKLTSDLGQHRDLEAQVAKLVNPSSVVSSAQAHGYVAPSHVTDLPQATDPPASNAGSPTSSSDSRSNGSR